MTPDHGFFGWNVLVQQRALFLAIDIEKAETSSGGFVYITLMIVDRYGKRLFFFIHSLLETVVLARDSSLASKRNSDVTSEWSEKMGGSTTTETTLSVRAMTTSSVCPARCVGPFAS